MNDDFRPLAGAESPAEAREDHTLGSSTIFRLCEEVIALREMNNRQHKLFEQSLTKARDEMRASSQHMTRMNWQRGGSCLSMPRSFSTASA